MRKGFALIVTLSVLSVMIALTAVLLSYLDEVRKDAAQTKALIQADLYYMDMQKIFASLGEQRKTAIENLYQFALPLYNESNANFSMTIRCIPAKNGININWLGLENNVTTATPYRAARVVFDNIVQTYGLGDPARLEELILQEIGGDKPWVNKETSRLAQKSGILSAAQFASVMQQYMLETDDQNIQSVPWEKFFVFSKDEHIELDANYLNAELIAMLFDIDLELVKDQWNPSDPNKTQTLKSFVENNGGDYEAYKSLFPKEFVDSSQCEVEFGYDHGKFSLAFTQNSGKVNGFEFERQ